VECIARAALPQGARGQAALLAALASSLRTGGPAAQAAAAAALHALSRAYPLTGAAPREGTGMASGAAPPEAVGLGPAPGTAAEPGPSAAAVAGSGAATRPATDAGAGAEPGSRAEAAALAAIARGFMAGLADASAGARRGAAAALGALPARLLAPAAADVVRALADAALVRAGRSRPSSRAWPRRSRPSQPLRTVLCPAPCAMVAVLSALPATEGAGCMRHRLCKPTG